MDRRGQQVDVDIATDTASLRVNQRRQQADCHDGPGHEVNHGQAKACGWAARLSCQGAEACLRLHQIIIAGPFGALIVPAIGRQMRADDRWIGCLQRFIGQTQLGRDIATQIVRHRMTAGDQLAQDGLPLGTAQIEGQGSFVQVEALEIQAFLLAQPVRPNPARRVTPTLAVFVGRLDLDDIGTELGKKHRPIGPSPILFGADDAKAGERERASCHAGFRFTHCFEMIIRCISLVPSPMHISMESR